MSKTESPANDPLLNADACGDHKVELVDIQMQQEVLRCALAAQEKLQSIRSEYADVRSLVYRIRELKANERPSRIQRNLVDDLVRQQLSVDDIATSLTCFLE
jgi:predicted nuclease with TOPRIM domain